MKKLNYLLIAAAVLGLTVSACKKKDDPAPTQNAGTIVVTGEITQNTTWHASDKILLNNYVYVTNGVTLTIEPGCIIKGDKDSKGSLIVEPGGKLIAAGTLAQPIIFTSNQPAGSRNYGDWGGVILCGNAQINTMAAGNPQPVVEGGPRTKYGSNDATNNGESSGTLSYVRVEFAGVAFSPNNEINGITFCGVGSGTQVDHCMVTWSGDDSYEWFGGVVNAKYLVAHRTWDDDFDTDAGFSGFAQFLVAQRDPNSADQSGSKFFESDNDAASSATATPVTKPIFSNVTAVIATPVTNGNAWSPQYVSAAHIRRNSQMAIHNSVLMGSPAGILFDKPTASATVFTKASGNDSARVRNTMIAGIVQTGYTYLTAGGAAMPRGKEVVYVVNGAGSLTPTGVCADTSSNPFLSYNDANNGIKGPYSYLLFPGFYNKTYVTSDAIRLTNPYNMTNPSFIPLTISPIVYTSAAAPTTPVVAPSYSGPTISNSFFTHVDYIGAFSGSDTWLQGWTNFDAQNTNYGSSY